MERIVLDVLAVVRLGRRKCGDPSTARLRRFAQDDKEERFAQDDNGGRASLRMTALCDLTMTTSFVS
jgi:hypothetical protein